MYRQLQFVLHTVYILQAEKFRNKFGKYLSIDEKVQTKNGCYIATCVYGSYDKGSAAWKQIHIHYTQFSGQHNAP